MIVLLIGDILFGGRSMRESFYFVYRLGYYRDFREYENKLKFMVNFYMDNLFDYRDFFYYTYNMRSVVSVGVL